MAPDLASTLVVMPALNEEATVGDVVAEVAAHLPEVTILVVDDGSTDATVGRATAAGAIVARLPYNLGVGGAMRVGYRYAVEHGFDAVVQVDSDGQHDPAAIPELLRALDDADIAIGARFAGVGDYRASGARRFAMRVLSVVLSRITGTRLTDTTSGFRATNRRATTVFARHYPAEYLGDTIEALIIAHRAGCRVTQVPVEMRSRAGGTPSHNPFRSAIYLARAMAALLLALIGAPRVRVDEGGAA